MSPKRTGIHYAWIVLAACCLSTGASLGIANNCAGMFFTPVSSEFGCSYANLSLTTTITSITICLSMVFLTKRLCLRYPMWTVLLGASLCYVPRLLLSFSNSVWQWWACAVFTGIAGSFLGGFSSSIILERWFKKRLPLALSISGSFSGVFGIVMSYILGHMISGVGWRRANLIGSIILIALTSLPNLLVSLEPRERGCIPYGCTEEDYVALQRPSESIVRVRKPPYDGRMMAILTICIADAIIATFIFHLNSYATSIKVTLFDVSLFTTMYMVGNLLSKSVFGSFVEKLGLRRASIGVYWIILAGIGMMLLPNHYVVLLGCMLFGASAAIYTCIVPLMGRALFDSEEYPEVMQRSIISLNLLVAVAGYVIGFIYDLTSTYLPVLAVMALFSVVSIVVLMRTLKK